jgi:hypothetical protein
VAQDIPQTPGSFRVTNGHARKAELCSKGLEVAKALSRSNPTSNAEVQRALGEFRELLERATLADGRCYAVQVSNVSLRFLYSIEDAVANGNPLLGRPEALDFLPLSAWQIVTKEWETAMAHLKDAIKELLPDSSSSSSSSSSSLLQEKIALLLKGVKTVLRKVRTRCLQPLMEPVETPEGIAWLDDVLDVMGPLMQATEDVTIAGFPPENPMQVASFASDVATLAQTLCQVVKGYPGNPTNCKSTPTTTNSLAHFGLEEEEMIWFDNAQAHFDQLLNPILETFPIR